MLKLVDIKVVRTGMSAFRWEEYEHPMVTYRRSLTPDKVICFLSGEITYSKRLSQFQRWRNARSHDIYNKTHEH